VGGCGGSPVWHTPADAPGVEDGEILRRDLQVYLTTIIRAVNAPLHPFDYGATVTEIASAVGKYQEQAAGAVDLVPVLADLRALRSAVGTWTAEANRRVHAAPEDHALRRRVNAALRRLARILVPLNYARGERFDHDPAIKLPAVPRLEAAALVADAAPAIRPFIRTALVRERNKVRAMLRQALREVQSFS
jgi:N-acetylated-alpha-linked acidic dipeptidase